MIVRNASLRLAGWFCFCALAGAASAADGPSHPFWIYRDGSYAWPGDYSYVAAVNYRDKSGRPEGETYDVAVTLTGAWGAWQPYATGLNFDRTGRKNLIFRLKPTNGLAFSCQFLKVGDLPVRVAPGNDGQLSVDISKYGPAPVAGVWATYTIPLDVVLNDAGTVLQSFYKFAIQSQSGIANDVYYIADVRIE